MVTASRSLKKRQELRQHLEDEQRKLRDRKKSINSLLSLIDQRDKLNEKIGHASQSIIDLGEAKEFVRELVGVSQRDFNAMLKTAKESPPLVPRIPLAKMSRTLMIVSTRTTTKPPAPLRALAAMVPMRMVTSSQ